MELFNFNKENEKGKNFEFMKLLEQTSRKVNTAIKIVVYSTVVGLGMTKNVSAQEFSENKNADFTVPPIEWQANVSDEQKNKIEHSITTQFNWLKQYMESPKFKERITKEYILTQGFIDAATDSVGNWDYKDFIDDPKFITFKHNENGDTVAMINNFEKRTEIKGDYVLSDEEFLKMANEEKVLEKFLPNPDTSNLSAADKEAIQSIISIRQWRLSFGNTIVVDSVLTDSAESVLGKFNVDTRDVKLAKNFTEEDNTTPVHEYTHQSTKNEGGFAASSLFLLENVAQSGDEYLNNPTEIHARINELRFLLDQEKINNPSIDNFTEQTYEEMLTNEKIMNNPAIKQLLQTLDKEDLIWFMNNLASLPISTTSFEDKV